MRQPPFSLALLLIVVYVGLLAAQAPTKAQADAILQKAQADVAATLKKAQADLDAWYASAPTATTITVNAGGDVQAALNQAQPGDTILLQAGATFVGNFVLPVKSGAAMITIRSSAPDTALPSAGVRITPAAAAQLPKLQSPSNQPALTTAAGAHHYTVLALELSARSDGEILAIGGDRDTQTTLAQVPHDLVIDRVYVHGDPTIGSKRGIVLHGATVSVLNSYVADIKANGQDAQALAGWNGPGPFTITNNYLEGAGENLLFGGSDPGIPNLVPSDIVIANNYLAKPLEWRLQPQWNVKNLLELKNARRVTITGNTLENNWSAAQQGWAVLFTPRNQDGRCPWCTVEDVVYTNNTLRHATAALAISGDDDKYPSGRLARVTIANSRFEDVDPKAWTGSAEPTDQIVLVMRGPVDVTLDNNDFSGAHWGSAVYLGEGGTAKAVRFKVTNNRWPTAYWGPLFGANASADAPFGPQGAWTLFVDPAGSAFSGNVVR